MMEPLIKAWLFDLGNTLMYIPQEFDEEERLNHLLEFKSVDIVRSIIYRLCDTYPGQSYNEFIERFDKEVNINNNSKISAEINEIWHTSVNKAILKPFTHEVLDSLRNAGVKLGLVSNTPPTSQIILERLDLTNRFDTIVFSCNSGFLKPDPRIFILALEQLDVSPLEAVIVGDKIRTDILGGAILGMHSILIEERLKGLVENKQNYVDAIVPNISDIRNTKLYKNSIHE